MGRGQQSQSVAPLMDSLSSAFVTQQRPTPGEKALGAAASLGLSLAILRLVVHYAKTKDNNYMIGGDLSSSASSDLVDENDSVFSWYKFVKHLVRRILEDSSAVFKASTSSVNRNQVDDGIVITHLGSCHCESVEFEVLAPRRLVASDGPGKIKYRHTKVKAANFAFRKGQDLLKTYYVTPKRANGNKHGAHAFCSRCGVHILFARTQNSRTIEINIECLSDSSQKAKVVSDMDSLTSQTIAEHGQWDDQLNRISEEKMFIFPNPSDVVSANSDWRLPQRTDDTSSVHSPPGRLMTMAMGHEDSFFTEPSEIRTNDDASSHSIAQSLTSNPTKRNPITLAPVSKPGTPQRDFTSPQFREQMRSYMKRHIAPSSSSATTSTAASTSGNSSSSVGESVS